MAATTFRTTCCPPLLWNPMSRHTPVKPSRLGLGFSPSCNGLPVVKAQTKNQNHRSPKPSESSEQKWVTKGLITESLPDNMFWVRLENGDVVLGYLSGKIRIKNIRVLPGDKVKIEVSRYDSTRGRIVYRIGNKDV